MIAAIITLGLINIALIVVLCYFILQVFKITDDLKDQVIAKDPLDLLAIKQAKTPAKRPLEMVDEDVIPVVEGQDDVFRRAIAKMSKGNK